MSVTVRPYRKRGKHGWEIDITTRLPNGQWHRERKKSPVSSKSAAQRWGEDRERHLVQNGLPEQEEPKEVPTLEEFAPRFVDEYARANRQKPSGIAAKETILNVHLIPHFGTKRLDAIATADVERMKTWLRGKAPKTVNNILTVLNTILKKAVEWGEIDRVPFNLRLLKTSRAAVPFHDFEAYEKLVDAARQIDWRVELIVLLGGEAGLRCGEMMALEWGDVNLDKRQLCVQRSEWKGHVTSTKGGRLRYVPMTGRLASALRQYRHLKSRRVLHQDDGAPLTQKIVQVWVKRAATRANVRGGVHILRHYAGLGTMPSDLDTIRNWAANCA
jgi:integrase